LLFPVTVKNYTSDRFIDAEWAAIENRMSDAFLMTIFGYGAPASDAEAVNLLKQAWGDTKSRRFEQTEIIDIRPQDELEEVWKPFIHTTHVDIVDDLQDSFLYNHPRRSVEAAWQQYIMAQFIDSNPMPTGCSLLELQAWFRPLVDAEDQPANQTR
jgi:hypothetical protein